MNFLNFNVTSNFKIESDKTVSLNELKKTIMKYHFLGYVIENDENNITLKFRLNNKFNFALVKITTTPNREKITPKI